MLLRMEKSWAWLLAAGLVLSTQADELILKSQATLTGVILAEKPDQIVLDVGYTVLVVPRGQITRIKRKKEAPDATPSAGPTTIRKGLYSSAATRPAEQPVREWVSQIGEAVVQVRTPGGLGSGFFINEDGYLITNFHVIEGETQISVEVYQQKPGQFERKTYKKVRIVAMNKFQDLALLQVEEPTLKFAWVNLGDSDGLAVGERVFAIGSPLGLERTVTEGIISTKTRQIQGELYLQTTAQINPGNSGGPLFSLRGEVVGVTSMKVEFGEGIGFAIPVERVAYFLNHREAYAYDNENPNNPYRYLPPPHQQPTAASSQKGQE